MLLLLAGFGVGIVVNWRSLGAGPQSDVVVVLVVVEDERRGNKPVIVFAAAPRRPAMGPLAGWLGPAACGPPAWYGVGG